MQNIHEEIENAIEECSIAIFELLQKNRIKLSGDELLNYSNSFFKKLDRQNNKVIT